MVPPSGGSTGHELKFINIEGPPQRRQYHTKDDSRWVEMWDKIEFLYSHLPLRLVREIMWCIYGFEKHESAYKKRFSVRSATKNVVKVQQSRQQGHQKPPSVTIQRVMIDLQEFSLQKKVTNRTPIISPQLRLEPQEEIFSGLDEYIRATFSKSSEAWGNDMLSFVGPNGERATAGPWERLADQCTAIEDLMKKMLINKADYMMENMLQLLPTDERIRDPSLLLQIWQACLKLLSIDQQQVLQYSTLTKFLAAIKGRLEVVPNKGCALLSVIDGLTRVSRNEMKETIRLAIFKTTATLQEVIGDENTMILGLWSLYSRTWKTSDESRSALLAKLQHVWTTNKAAELPEHVTVSYYHTYAVHSISQDKEKAASMARDLRDRLCRSHASFTIWSMETLAFQVCSKILARHLRFLAFKEVDQLEKRKKRHKYYEVMEHAIKALEQGDAICKVSAASMATTLGYWLEKSELQESKPGFWHVRANDVLNTLPE